MRSFRPSKLAITDVGALPYFEVTWSDPITNHELTIHRKIRRKRSLLEMESSDLESIFEQVAIPRNLRQSCGMWQATNGERAGWHDIWVQGPNPWLAEPIIKSWLREASGPNYETAIINIILKFYDPRLSGDLFAQAYRFMICGCDFCCEPKVRASKRRRRDDRNYPNRILWSN